MSRCYFSAQKISLLTWLRLPTRERTGKGRITWWINLSFLPSLQWNYRHVPLPSGASHLLLLGCLIHFECPLQGHRLFHSLNAVSTWHKVFISPGSANPHKHAKQQLQKKQSAKLN